MFCKPVAKLALVAAAASAPFAAVVARAEDGQATWHVFGEDVACPGSFETTKVFALDARLFAQSASKCGMCSVVTGRKGSVVARFVDKCVGSACKEMDLSKDAFRLIADVDEGITDIKFSELRPCEELQQVRERQVMLGVTIPSLDGENVDGVFGGNLDGENGGGEADPALAAAPGEEEAEGAEPAAGSSTPSPAPSPSPAPTPAPTPAPASAAGTPAPTPAPASAAGPPADARNGTTGAVPSPGDGGRPAPGFASPALGSASPAAAAAVLAPLAALLPFALAAGTLI